MNWARAVPIAAAGTLASNSEIRGMLASSYAMPHIWSPEHLRIAPGVVLCKTGSCGEQLCWSIIDKCWAHASGPALCKGLITKRHNETTRATAEGYKYLTGKTATREEVIEYEGHYRRVAGAARARRLRPADVGFQQVTDVRKVHARGISVAMDLTIHKSREGNRPMSFDAVKKNLTDKALVPKLIKYSPVLHELGTQKLIVLAISDRAIPLNMKQARGQAFNSTRTSAAALQAGITEQELWDVLMTFDTLSDAVDEVVALRRRQGDAKVPMRTRKGYLKTTVAFNVHKWNAAYLMHMLDAQL